MTEQSSSSTSIEIEMKMEQVKEEGEGVSLTDLFASPPRSPQLRFADADAGANGDEKPGGPSRSGSGSGSGSGSPIGEEDLKVRTSGRKRGRKPNKEREGQGEGQGEEDKGPILIDDLPIAWDEAHETFESLPKCHYERKDLGLSREQDEMMVCDCVWDKRDPDADPCGPESDCINRALFIECLADECRAGKHCRNQQFSKQQYANIEVVLTEKKGFGLRAAGNLPANTLVYEYIGEVVAERTFRKRMQQYADEGIRHFYFMMLQKEEYIDATKKGGIGRFANHSCNPNSEVQKWVVGRRLRMGIFTKRDVLKGEEITFNYNVDRYGHEAQICYCGEHNCVGTIGGKTQTDIGTMNDLFLDALGISDEVEAMGLKGTKKKKAKQLDEDFIPTLRPIEEHEPQKVAAAIRQSMENTKMMSRLLQRIKMTEEPAIQRELMRMHGFSLMSMILTDLAEDREVVLLTLESLSKWKLQYRNKIEDSNIEEPITILRDGTDPEISALAKELLSYWSTLGLSYRIPRVSKIKSLDEDDDAGTTTIAEADSLSSSLSARKHDTWANTAQIQIDVAPIRPRPIVPSFHRPRPPPPPPQPRPFLSQSASSDRLKLDAIIALAQQNVQATALPIPPSPAAESSRSGSRPEDDEDRRKRMKRSHYSAEPEDEESKKERRLTKLVGEVVVRSMSKYKSQMEHDTFKRYAKECTHILVEKEKKGHSYTTTRNPTLSEDKKDKMKAFTKEFTHKVLKRLKEKGKLRKPSSTVSMSGSGGTPTTTTSLATPGGSTVLEVDTPLNDKHGELVDDIFGVDIDMEMGTPVPVPISNGKEIYSPSSPTTRLSNGIKSTPTTATQRKLNGNGNSNGNGGYTVVERLDLKSLGKINGVSTSHPNVHTTTISHDKDGASTDSGTPSSITLASNGPSPAYN